jgi:hypothetical protein
MGFTTRVDVAIKLSFKKNKKNLILNKKYYKNKYL